MLAKNRIHHMDCLEGMRQLPDGFIDCCVTDPPYGISFMGRGWDYSIPAVAVWKEVLRVLKPGGHMLVACGTRTQHRMAVNMEDAGFEIRDVICWHYGQGFPKSLDIGKAMDMEAGAEREVVGSKMGKGGENLNKIAREDAGDRDDAKGCGAYGKGAKQTTVSIPVTKASSEAAKKWDGWGTALKPATEFWTLARKPLAGKTIAANMVKYGVGGLNIDACRIETTEYINTHERKTNGVHFGQIKAHGTYQSKGQEIGRFPSNLILDEFMAEAMDEQSGILTSGQPVGKRKAVNNVYGQYSPGQDVTGYGDEGGASRFFYVAKADAAERGAGNTHPTVKPMTLMYYLIKLICPIEPGRVVLEPFAGSGTTCIAARLLGMDYMAFELSTEYVGMAEDRLRRELGLFYEG
jgi:DNA modification methylase